MAENLYKQEESEFKISTKCYSGVIMSVMAFQIAGVYIVCLTVCLSAGQRKRQKLRVTGPCEGNSPVTGGLPPRRGSNAENVRWRHHVQCNKAKVM